MNGIKIFNILPSTRKNDLNAMCNLYQIAIEIVRETYGVFKTP
jgi:hypothetical protein